MAADGGCCGGGGADANAAGAANGSRNARAFSDSLTMASASETKDASSAATVSGDGAADSVASLEPELDTPFSVAEAGSEDGDSAVATEACDNVTEADAKRASTCEK